MPNNDELPQKEDPTYVTSAEDADQSNHDETDSTEASSNSVTAENKVDGGGEVNDTVDLALLEREGEIAADYLEGLLDIADLDGDIDMDVEGQRSSVAIVGQGLDDLVGDDGKCLEALQELTRLAVHVKTGQRSGLMLDIADYRKERREEVTRITKEAIATAQSTNQRFTLNSMTPFERKVVHDVVATSGLRSESDGFEPDRFVVIMPALTDSPVA